MKADQRRFGILIFAAVTAAVVLAGGCTSTPREYRPVTQSRFPDDASSNPQRGTNYQFSVIEFDDQGEMWERAQLTETMEGITSLKSNGGPVTLVIFVHGWKHDASRFSSNLADFHGFITNLARAELTIEERMLAEGLPEKPRRIVGVYIAWRGNIYQSGSKFLDWVTAVPLNLSFWNRKRVAAQVAGISCTEAILSLATKARLNDPDSQSKVILIGHSFGGLVVERAVTQAMLGTLLATLHLGAEAPVNGNSETNKAVESLRQRLARPPVDLVLLVNPASEALVAKRMIAALENPVLSANQSARPWIVAVSSKADWATGAVFPVGQTLGSLRERFRSYVPQNDTNRYTRQIWPANRGSWPGKTFEFTHETDSASRLHHATNRQHSYYATTAPHNNLLLSHDITNATPKNNEAFQAALGQSVLEHLLAINLFAETNYFDPAKQFIVPKGRTNVLYEVKDRSTNRLNHSAYWVINAPRQLIPDHNTIFTTNFYAMAAGLFRMTQYFDHDTGADDATPPATNGVPKIAAASGQ